MDTKERWRLDKVSVKYEVLKRLVKALGLKNAWSGKSAEEIEAKKKKENEKNRIPRLSNPELEMISLVENA